MLILNVTTRTSQASYCTMQYFIWFKAKANSFMKVIPMPHGKFAICYVCHTAVKNSAENCIIDFSLFAL